jgi:hypothetical protein
MVRCRPGGDSGEGTYLSVTTSTMMLPARRGDGQSDSGGSPSRAAMGGAHRLAAVDVRTGGESRAKRCTRCRARLRVER